MICLFVTSRGRPSCPIKFPGGGGKTEVDIGGRFERLGLHVCLGLQIVVTGIQGVPSVAWGSWIAKAHLLSLVPFSPGFFSFSLAFYLALSERAAADRVSCQDEHFDFATSLHCRVLPSTASCS